MLFGHIRRGQVFRYNIDCWIKISEFYAHNFEKVFVGGLNFDDEVELISKCSNCSKYNDGFNLGCGKVFVDVNSPNEKDPNKEDPETFSCCKFRLKQGIFE